MLRPSLLNELATRKLLQAIAFGFHGATLTPTMG